MVGNIKTVVVWTVMSCSQVGTNVSEKRATIIRVEEMREVFLL
jgi:hypothetical protein